jgi:stage III sporulation protein AA
VVLLKTIDEIAVYLPQRIYECVCQIPNFEEISEIRFSLDKPALVSYGGHTAVIKSKNMPLVTDKAVFDFIISKLTGGSMYSVNESIKNGFVTIDGGHRVGICGTAVIDDGNIKHVKNISSLCFRICRQIKGCADGIASEIIEKGRINNVLIASPPGCGKTTLLRDICRIIGGGSSGIDIKRVGIADERGEIAALNNGVARFDVGVASFVCDSYPKAYAMKLMLRSMSPDVLVTDEIGSIEDFVAVKDSLKSGVSVIATAHATDIYDIKTRFGNEIKSFDKIIFLKGKGRIASVYRRVNNDY